ncbi:EPIDERMAL PATTERNING FACTOR-like protein 5 [Andrographis paniculata]|uniref:EPIDERMAL PATTERNING FACTOR-like protein 5 n=1 Tax=Andrographis paniculata TaxID=175694 RepID=UPI0021E973DA|nr:EPIDERMAL PATTERNING FACTOR-like protein 5 [Andrographis paniculata]
MKGNYGFTTLLVICFVLAVEGSENAAEMRRTLQGSTPPNCDGQCGGCKPCNRVLVEVSPGNFVWQCKCGGSGMADAAESRRVSQRSEPPSCVGQCGGCTPCNRILVEVSPGNFVWRCKCGGL